MRSTVYFVENLTVTVWLSAIWPRLFRNRKRGERGITRCYVIDGSSISLLVARASARLLGVSVERLDFRLMDVRDQEGRLLSLRVAQEDLFRVQEYIVDELPFRDLVNSGEMEDRMPQFLIKNILAGNIDQRGKLHRTLYLIQACNWKTGFEQKDTSQVVLFLERRLWSRSISRYASEYGVSIIPVRPAVSLRVAVRSWLPQSVINLLRYIRYGVLRPAAALLKPRGGVQPVEADTNEGASEPIDSGTSPPGPNGRPLVALEGFGQPNPDQPELHSDFFFWHESSLRGEDLLLTVSVPRDPLDKKKFAALRRHGITAVALNFGATTVRDVPVFSRSMPSMSVPGGWPPAAGAGRESMQSPEGNSLIRQQADYHSLRAYWLNLFESFNVKVYVTWYRFDGNHCVIADALQELGGITTVYQRSLQTRPTPLAMMSADVAFGYSQSMAEVERCQNSSIRYHVTTGFLGDHRFAQYRDKSHAVGDALKSRGAKRIVAFFDENSTDDPRWHTGHSLVRENYAFLLNKVLAEPWLGLVIKPKTPISLRRRLGPVAQLLEQAEATGRCYVYEGGALQGSHTPAEAAFAADLVIHGHLCAGTAGMEAALCGIPTLLLDREVCPENPLYELGVGRVVFQDWEGLWEGCLQHWSTPGGVTGFGDWYPKLEELDPFRDGRAAERMGQYIQWLIEGYQRGLDRETIMADAAERYCTLWGQDKITEVRSGLLLHRNGDQPLALADQPNRKHQVSH